MKKVILILTTLLSVHFSFAQWQQFSVFPNTDPIQCVAARGALIAAGTQNGIFISTNGGANWTISIAGLSDINITSLMISGSNIISGSRTGKIAYKTLAGTSWTEVNSAGPDYVSSFFKNGTLIWAKYFGGACKTYESLDNGVSWSEVSSLGGDCFKNFIWSNGYLFHGGWLGPNVSADNGATWTSAHNGYNETSDYNLMGADETGHIILSRGYWGSLQYATLYYATASSNPTWQYANGFLNNVAAITSFAGFSNFIFAGVNDSTTFLDNGVQSSTDGGANWSLDNGIMGGVNCLAIDSVNLYAGAQDGKIWKKSLMTATSTNDISTIKNSINIYPNPTNSHINFSVQANVKLTNVTGQIVANRKNTNTLDISDQPTGIYFLTLTDNMEQVVQRCKIVKE